MADFELPPSLQLTEPSLTIPRASPSLAPALQLDPSLGAAPARSPAERAAAAGLFPHYAEPGLTPFPVTPLGGDAGHGAGGHGGIHLGPHRDPFTNAVTLGVNGSTSLGPFNLQGGVGVSPKDGELSASAGVSLPLGQSASVGLQGEIGADHEGHPHGHGGLVVGGRF